MNSQVKVGIHRDRWDRQARHQSPVAAAHLVHQGKPVDCYGDLASEYAQRLDLGPTDRVLEVGCGSGCLLMKLRPLAMEIVGTDFSPEMLKHLDGEDVETRCCEAQSMPFPDASFDKVYCHGVVQYFPDEAYAETAVNEMLRVCKPGGRVLVGDVINGLLERQYHQEAIRTNHHGIRRIRKLVCDYVIRPFLQWKKYGVAVDTKPLCLTPLFFKRLFADSPHQWAPLLETVESKPLPFLRYRYDVLILKNAAQQCAPYGWCA